MRAGDLLRQLDRRLLPPLARGLTELTQGPSRAMVLTGTAVASCLVVLVTAFLTAGQSSGGDPTVGDVTRVGVVQGESVPGYVASARGELAALATAPAGPGGETYALVTLAAYLAPDRLGPALGGVDVSEVFARVPLPDRQTEIVRIPALRLPDDLLAGMARVADDKDREARDYRSRAAAVAGGGGEERVLRTIYDTGAQVAAAEAAAYRSRCSCLYAAVVRATPVALQQVATRPGVRAVDPAPEVTRLDRVVFTPPLPEQTGVVVPPSDTGVPAPDDPAAAPQASAPTADPSGVSTADPRSDSPAEPPRTDSPTPDSGVPPASSSSPPAVVDSPPPSPETGATSDSLPSPTGDGS